MFGSRLFLTMLYRLGFSVSYDEVTCYRQSVAQTEGTALPEKSPMSFTKWSADNVDHNVATLDGLGTFHDMCIISMSVHDNINVGQVIANGSFTEVTVQRCTKVKATELVMGKNVTILPYSRQSLLCSTVLIPIDKLKQSYAMPLSVKLDLLWNVGWYFRGKGAPRPNWSGFMQDVTSGSGTHPPVADIRMLPIIDLNPRDKSCILSTLSFICNPAKLLDIEVPCVTFDQPLWIMTVEVNTAERLNIVCRLGSVSFSYELLRQYWFSHGRFRSHTSLECCYDPNTANTMMSGKSMDRAICGHFLVDSCQHVLLLRKVFCSIEVELSASGELDNTDVQNIRELYDGIVGGKSTFNELSNSGSFNKLENLLNSHKASREAGSRTAKLWIRYAQYIQNVKLLIRAELCGDWSLHLESILRMLNLFATTGHSNYAKCARLYLQMMQQLPVTHPWLHDKFINGMNHTVRRSDRYWFVCLLAY
jgi:hypothetical protein